ncbi:glycosyltransferase family 4 protein [Ferruginibacter sp.]|nr:glycosyltransferase family 4 protein [Ferruginibacter sp.]
MIIAVNASFVNTHSGNNADFIFDYFSKLAQQYPQHQFIYIVDKGFDEKYITSKNITPVIAGQQTKSPLLLQYRLNYKIPAILRKYKANVFVSTDGYCLLRTKVPQCVIVNDLSFLQQPQYFTATWLKFYKNNTAKYLAKAETIITTSQFLKQEIITHYKIESKKIEVAYQCAGKYFKPVIWLQKDVAKEHYTDGKEYFLYSGVIDSNNNLITLLKAFSFFKKRQKSNMQLVLASKTTVTDKVFIKDLASFKYRAEVKLCENLQPETLAQITASAYAMVYPLLYQGNGISLIEAMQADVPVITADNTAIPEICGDAALYTNPNDFNDIADKMMLLFKDEDKRNQHIIKGRQQAGLYNADKTAAAIWQAIIKCVDSLN